MSTRAVFVSLVLGVMWQAMLVDLFGRRVFDPLDGPLTGPLAGAIAGLCAGELTFRSRHRRQGRESIRDGVLTFYAGVLSYALALSLIGVVVYVCVGNATLRGIESYPQAVFGVCLYAVVGVILWGVVLIPLCFMTRFLFWQLCGERTQLPPNTEESARG
jgi:hypothetical protein